MKKFYLLVILSCFILLGAKAYNKRSYFRENIASIDTTRRFTRATSKIIDTRPDRPKNELRVNITPFKPSTRPVSQSSSAGQSSSPVSTGGGQKAAAPDFKALSNVKVYPNPAEDQINISYTLSKDANVTIKIMDVLGNEIATLLSQRLPAGEQNHSFVITSRLNSGYYFIRLIAGNETIIKRISIL